MTIEETMPTHARVRLVRYLLRRPRRTRLPGTELVILSYEVMSS